MTDRDHGDDEVEPGSGETVALAGRTRRRTRKRSLRVPVDEVPRRPSNPDGELLADGEVDGLPPLASEPTQVADDVTSSVEVGVEIAEIDLPEEELAEELHGDDASDALESEPTRVGPPRRRRDTIVSAEETASDAPAAPEPEPSAAAAVDAGPSGAVPADAARPELGAPELGAPEPAQSVSAESATAAVGPSDEAGEGAPFELRRSDPGRPSSDVVERTTPGSLPSPEPRPSVVVARVVAISSPPPAPVPMRPSAPPPPPPAALQADADDEAEDEPELSISESFDDLEVDVGDDDRHASAADDEDDDAGIPDELSASEIELPDADELNADERPPPPPPAAALAQADPEEELAPDDLEVEASGETSALLVAPEEGARKLRSAPPPPPEKPARAAPPPPAAPPPAASAAPAAPPASAPAAAPPAAPAAAPADATADAPRRARKKGEWWDGFFNDDYLRTVPPPNPRQIARQCDFIEARLALKEGSTILDVGCGLGLHAIELTRRGYLVVGLDLSLPMLSRAADEAQDQGFRINFLHADMREMNFDGAFDAVLCWGTTFGYFDDDQNRAVVERLHRALRPKGKLLLEVVNRDFVVPNQPNLVWFEGDGCVVMEETQVNFITSRLTVKRTVILDDGRQRDNAYSVRLYALHELGQVLHQRGFRVIEVTGREATPGVFFGADSPKLIILAERRIQNQTPPTPPKKPAAEGGEGAPTGEVAAAPPEPEGSAEG